MPNLRILHKVKDTITFRILKMDVPATRRIRMFVTEERNIPQSNNLKWRVEYFPAGFFNHHNVSVRLKINVAEGEHVKTKFKFVLLNSDIQAEGESDIGSLTHEGVQNFASHETLWPLFVDGIVRIKCDVEFDIFVPFVPTVLHLLENSDHVPLDVDLVVDSERLKVHKSYLSLLSKDFADMFSDSDESNSNEVKIADFDFKTVNNAIGYCYGRGLDELALEDYIGIICFAEKYNIKAVTAPLESLPYSNLSIENLATILEYAHNDSKDSLFAECVKFLKRDSYGVNRAMKAAGVPPSIIIHLWKSAYNLKTTYDVLRHALGTMKPIVTYLENILRSTITIHEICDTIEYAWESKRVDLQNDCATFVHSNLIEVMKLKAFYNLPAETFHGTLKLAYELNQPA